MLALRHRAHPRSSITRKLRKLRQIHHTASVKTVFWLNRPGRCSGATACALWWLPWLLSCCSAGWLLPVQAAEPATGREVPADTSPQEPGAAALLDQVPLQVGLREHGLPPSDDPAETPTLPSAPSQTPSPGMAKPRDVSPTAPVAHNRLLILDRRHRRLQVMENGREVRRYPVAVGMPGWETPVGTFTVIEKTANPTWEHPANGHLLPPGPANPLGSRWIGFYRDCRGRSGFNGQEHLVVKGCVTAGFHGTPNRSSVGRAVSHGCVRLFDEHAKELFDLVSLGTTVKVLP